MGRERRVLSVSYKLQRVSPIARFESWYQNKNFDSEIHSSLELRTLGE